MESWREELYANELCHHGIKGQKWGERNGPPYPLEGAARKRAYEKMGALEKSGRKKKIGAAFTALGGSTASAALYGILAGAIAAPPVVVPALCVAAGAAWLTTMGLEIGGDVNYYNAGKQQAEINFRPEDYEEGSYSNTAAKRRFRGSVLNVSVDAIDSRRSAYKGQNGSMNFRDLGERAETRRLAKEYGNY